MFRSLRQMCGLHDALQHATMFRSLRQNVRPAAMFCDLQ
jgi:hypothetical protein